ncbi:MULTISPECIES: LacI family DNA-binding transcriptional regulator [Oscillospiraceae]|uniref:LacI family DNA-binding transcriptional regulator n=1 Tax=Oscillospiraceae TaxID=216572 RepID=UPI0009A68649|nr:MULTISPECIES: LacI family DNA-binding transcriptional regulator [Oscillospiraceae]RGB68288.1 LacI family transcriptional regulator [Harryflintia acetispora]
MSVSILDVAKRCGLSTVTVSRVINNTGNVKEESRQKVLAAIRELGYTPNAAARSLVRGKTGLIGVVLPDLKGLYTSRVVVAAKAKLLEKGYFLSLFLFDDITREDNARYILDEQRVDGFFVIAPGLESPVLEKLKRYNLPVILLDNQYALADYPYVEVDDYLGGVMAAEHLIGLGHRQIGYIDGPNMLCCHERRAGAIDTLRKHGLRLLCEGGGDIYDFSVGYRVANRWIERGTIPSAVIGVCDSVAAGAIGAFKEHGYRVPQDISVVGFDNIPLYNNYSPRLTSVEQPVPTIAEKSVEMLLQLLAGRELTSRFLKLPPRLVVGESTRPVNS